MPRPKRGEQVPPPPTQDEWDLRYATKESLAFAEMEKQFPGSSAEAKARLKAAPTTRSDVQKLLRGTLGGLVRGQEAVLWMVAFSGRTLALVAAYRMPCSDGARRARDGHR